MLIASQEVFHTIIVDWTVNYDSTGALSVTHY